mgnify:CR=1 FL=1
MTQEDIIRMAREAGFKTPDSLFPDTYICKEFHLQHFAKLVAAAEREACAKVCEDLAELNRVSPTDSMWEWGECSAAIRARGTL